MARSRVSTRSLPTLTCYLLPTPPPPPSPPHHRSLLLSLPILAQAARSKRADRSTDQQGAHPPKRRRSQRRTSKRPREDGDTDTEEQEGTNRRRRKRRDREKKLEERRTLIHSTVKASYGAIASVAKGPRGRRRTRRTRNKHRAKRRRRKHRTKRRRNRRRRARRAAVSLGDDALLRAAFREAVKNDAHRLQRIGFEGSQVLYYIILKALEENSVPFCDEDPDLPDFQTFVQRGLRTVVAGVTQPPNSAEVVFRDEIQALLGAQWTAVPKGGGICDQISALRSQLISNATTMISTSFFMRVKQSIHLEILASTVRSTAVDDKVQQPPGAAARADTLATKVVCKTEILNDDPALGNDLSVKNDIWEHVGDLRTKMKDIPALDPKKKNNGTLRQYLFAYMKIMHGLQRHREACAEALATRKAHHVPAELLKPMAIFPMASAEVPCVLLNDTTLLRYHNTIVRARYKSLRDGADADRRAALEKDMADELRTFKDRSTTEKFHFFFPRLARFTRKAKGGDWQFADSVRTDGYSVSVLFRREKDDDDEPNSRWRVDSRTGWWRQWEGSDLRSENDPRRLAPLLRRRDGPGVRIRAIDPGRRTMISGVSCDIHPGDFSEEGNVRTKFVCSERGLDCSNRDLTRFKFGTKQHVFESRRPQSQRRTEQHLRLANVRVPGRASKVNVAAHLRAAPSCRVSTVAAFRRRLEHIAPVLTSWLGAHRFGNVQRARFNVYVHRDKSLDGLCRRLVGARPSTENDPVFVAFGAGSHVCSSGETAPCVNLPACMPTPRFFHCGPTHCLSACCLAGQFFPHFWLEIICASVRSCTFLA